MATAPLPQRGTAPNFRPMSIVVKRSPISATAELLYCLSPLNLFRPLTTYKLFYSFQVDS